MWVISIIPVQKGRARERELKCVSMMQGRAKEMGTGMKRNEGKRGEGNKRRAEGKNGMVGWKGRMLARC